MEKQITFLKALSVMDRQFIPNRSTVQNGLNKRAIEKQNSGVNVSK